MTRLALQGAKLEPADMANLVLAELDRLCHRVDADGPSR